MSGKPTAARKADGIARILAIWSVALLLVAACGTLEVGIEQPPAADPHAHATIAALATDNARLAEQAATLGPAVLTAAPMPTETIAPPAALAPTSTPSRVKGWIPYSNPVLGVSLEHPTNWSIVPGETDEGSGVAKLSGEDGFLALGAIGNPTATIDDVAAAEAGHRLQPYGSRPTIESLQIEGQEARLILPSADQPGGLSAQAALIVLYPYPIDVEGSRCEFLLLHADRGHIREIATTIRFEPDATVGRTNTPVSPIVWRALPPGLVYKTMEVLWWIDADEQQVQLHEDPQALLSLDRTRLLNYDSIEKDLWLFNLSDGSGWNLTLSPDRVEFYFRWWAARPDTVLFTSFAQESEQGPGIMGYLTTINANGQGYRLLDAEHDTGPGKFAPSPDGQTIAYGGGSTGWLYHWATGPEVFDPADYGLTGTKGIHMGSPAWSPDSTKLAWVVGGGLAGDGSYRIAVAIFDLETHSSWLLHPYDPAGRGGWPAAPVWSPDGRWLAYGAGAKNTDEAGLWVMRADEQREEERYLGLGGNPVWSPDGAWLAFNGALDNGMPAIVLAKVGAWDLHPLALPPNAYLVDWIIPLP